LSRGLRTALVLQALRKALAKPIVAKCIKLVGYKVK